jgi:hypothetical protein
VTLRSSARSRVALQLEIVALRRQLQVLQRARPRRLRLAKADRWLWVALSRVRAGWRTALVIARRIRSTAQTPRRRLSIADIDTWRAGVQITGGKGELGVRSTFQQAQHRHTAGEK